MMKRTRMDVNSDVGESFGVYKLGLDEEVIPHITSANIACGSARYAQPTQTGKFTRWSAPGRRACWQASANST